MLFIFIFLISYNIFCDEPKLNNTQNNTIESVQKKELKEGKSEEKKEEPKVKLESENIENKIQDKTEETKEEKLPEIKLIPIENKNDEVIQPQIEENQKENMPEIQLIPIEDNPTPEQINDIPENINEEIIEDEKEEEEEKIEYPIGKLELLDKIEAQVVTSTPDTTDTEIITTSDIRKRSFDGSQYKLDDLIDEILADNLGKTFKINLTDDDVNKHLKRMKLSDKVQLAQMVEKWGFNNLEEFYETFKKIYRASSALHYEMSSQMIVLDEEIKEYYNANPIEEEACYTIETAFIPLNMEKDKETVESDPVDQKSDEDLKKNIKDSSYSANSNIQNSIDPLMASKDKQKQELEEYIAGKKKLDINWEFPITVKEHEISQNNQFIQDMDVKSIYLKEMPDGFDLFKLISKKPNRLVPLEERKKEIVDKLQSKKQEEAYQKMKDKLVSQAIIHKPNYETPKLVEELGL